MSRADAQALAQAGWPVFPCRDKRPVTPNGHHDATTHVNGAWPEDAQVAIAVPPGLLVVDIDAPDETRPDGFASLSKLEAKYGSLPPTLTVTTGRGGEHRWFRANGASLSQKSLDPGVDTRIGGKGYVIAPPSVHHETGRPYAWQNTLPIADAPPWLLAALAAPPAVEPTTEAPSGSWPTPSTDALVAARKWLATSTPSIQGQDGSGSLMRAAGVLVRGFALGPEIGLHLLREYNERAQPPWDEYDLARAVQSAATSSREPSLGSMLPDVDLLAAIRSPRIESATSGGNTFDDEIFAPLPDVDYLVHGIAITAGPPCMIAGYGYSGKTAAAQQLALDLAREDHQGAWMNPRPVWGHFRGSRRARVLHVDYEQGALSRRRYQWLAQAAGLTGEAFRGHLRLVTYPTWYTNTAQGYAALERAIEGFDLVIIDSFRASNPGLEENASDAREPLDGMARLSEKSGAAFLVIHHARKPSRDAPGGAKMVIRGSGAIFDGCGSVLVFEGEKDQPKVVHHEKEKTGGQTLDDFTLIVEAHEGGFRVRATDLVKQTPAERSSAVVQEHVEKIRAWLLANVFFKNREQIARAIGVSNSAATAAIGAMTTSGELISSGSYRDRTYHLSGITPARETT